MLAYILSFLLSICLIHFNFAIFPWIIFVIIKKIQILYLFRGGVLIYAVRCMFYRLFRGVAKYIVYGNTFSSFGWLRSLHATMGCEGGTEAGGERPELNEGLHL